LLRRSFLAMELTTQPSTRGITTIAKY